MWRSLLVLLLLATWTTAGERKPNIVLILADDLGINDLSCYGRKDQNTPVLDKLAAEGTRFACAYCALPICSASRAALLTGKCPARLHLTTFLPGRPDKPSQKLLHPKIEPGLALEETTLAEALKAAGYRTACIGKWHLGEGDFGPQAQGFDVSFPGHATTPPSATEGGKGEYELTAKAIEFIAENPEKPFFLYLAHNSPHVPLGAKAELVTKHAGAFNPLYAAMVETLDDSVGLILKKLDELKLSDDTIVVFTSDNGGLHVLEMANTPATQNGIYRGGKGYLYEGGLREPLIVRWPGKVKAGVVEEVPVSLADLMPTFLELAGAPKVEGLDYVSIAGLLAGQGKRATEFYWHFPHYTNQGSKPGGAVRIDQWKLIENYEDGSAELFDLATDPGEKTNIAMQQAARVAEMRGKLAVWRSEVGAQENTANPDFDFAWYKEIYNAVDAGTGKAWRAALDRPERVAPEDRPKTAPGFLVLHAKDAIVHGDALRYEAQPEKNTLGFWKYVGDTASWIVELPAGGRYIVEALAGCGKGSGGAVVQIDAGGPPLQFTVAETGHFQNFTPQLVGTMRLAGGKNTVTVTPKSKPGAAVMDLRQLTFTKVSN